MSKYSEDQRTKVNMKKFDCFVKGSVKLEVIKLILEEHSEHIYSDVVSILNDKGDVIAYHFLASRAFVKQAKIKYPNKIYLYNEVISYFNKDGKPLHIFGPFGRIDDTTDIDDKSKDVQYKSGSGVAISATVESKKTKKVSIENDR